MKVIVLWEDPIERTAAETLAMVVDKIGTTFQNCKVVGNGTAIQITAGPTYPVDAVCMPFEELSNPGAMGSDLMTAAEFQRLRRARNQHKAGKQAPPKTVRKLIFDMGEE